MMKIFAFLLLVPLLSFSQRADTLIDKGIYRSYYSFSMKVPICVEYKLWKGGGTCKKKKMHFRNDVPGLNVSSKDYFLSGYDQGHMANAEDFSNMCDKVEQTYRFYNCLPQTPNLNRSVWKKWEISIRKESQRDSLLVLAGGIFTSNKTIGNGVHVPDRCWKVVKSLSTGKILHVLIFTNSKKANFREIEVGDLVKMLGYDPLLKDI